MTNLCMSCVYMLGIIYSQLILESTVGTREKKEFLIISD